MLREENFVTSLTKYVDHHTEKWRQENPDTQRYLTLIAETGIQDYPEIKQVDLMLGADPRPEHFVRVTMTAVVEIGEDWRGLITLPPDNPEHMNVDVIIAKAKQCVDYHRAKAASHE